MEELHESPTTDAQDETAVKCIEQTEQNGLSDAAVAAIVNPGPLQELLRAWDERTVAAVAPATGSPVEYERCVAEADLPGNATDADNPHEVLTAMTEEMLELAPPPDLVPIGSDSPSDAWTEYTAIEAGVLAAEWNCAAPVYDEGMRKMPHVIASFKADYQPELAELRRHWEKTEQDARNLGWSPDRPFGTLTLE